MHGKKQGKNYEGGTQTTKFWGTMGVIQYYNCILTSSPQHTHTHAQNIKFVLLRIPEKEKELQKKKWLIHRHLIFNQVFIVTVLEASMPFS